MAGREFRGELLVRLLPVMPPLLRGADHTERERRPTALKPDPWKVGPAVPPAPPARTEAERTAAAVAVRAALLMVRPPAVRREAARRRRAEAFIFEFVSFENQYPVAFDAGTVLGVGFLASPVEVVSDVATPIGPRLWIVRISARAGQEDHAQEQDDDGERALRIPHERLRLSGRLGCVTQCDRKG